MLKPRQLLSRKRSLLLIRRVSRLSLGRIASTRAIRWELRPLLPRLGGLHERASSRNLANRSAEFKLNENRNMMPSCRIHLDKRILETLWPQAATQFLPSTRWATSSGLTLGQARPSGSTSRGPSRQRQCAKRISILSSSMAPTLS